MKIHEVVVGTASTDTMILKPDEPVRHAERPQVGYKIRIGRRLIPTPGYADSDAKGVIGSMVPS